MENQQINQTVITKKKGYLSTEKINLGNFSAEKLTSDLDALKSSEKKNAPLGVNSYAKTEMASKEMLALKLSNPFRGY